MNYFPLANVRKPIAGGKKTFNSPKVELANQGWKR
jgi:hypothetical protein